MDFIKAVLKENMVCLLKIIHLAEKLKMEKRHSWLSNQDQESVAEHCWRLSLMVLLISPKLKHPINLERALIMAIIHDLPEIRVGDQPDFEVKTKEHALQKFLQEKAAMQEIAEKIKRPDLLEIWEEFEERKSDEARLVCALDRLEGQIQHNESDLGTWLDIEKKRQFLGHGSYCHHEEALLKLAQLCAEESREKLSEDDKDLINQWMEGKELWQCLKEVGIKGVQEKRSIESNVCEQ